MDIVQIQEKYFSHSYKARCYQVDIQTLYEAIALLNSYDTIFKRFIKALRTEQIRFMVLMDESSTVYVIDDKNNVGKYNIGDRYPLVFDEVVNNYSSRVTLNKDDWDNYVSETMWIDNEPEKDEVAILRGIKEFKPKIFGKKDKIVIVDKDAVKNELSKDKSFVCSTIIALLSELKSIVYWKEDRVLAIEFRTNAMLPLNLNEKTFENVLKHIKSLEQIK